MIVRIYEDIKSDIERTQDRIADLTVKKGQAMKAKQDYSATDEELKKEKSKLADLYSKQAKESVNENIKDDSVSLNRIIRNTVRNELGDNFEINGKSPIIFVSDLIMKEFKENGYAENFNMWEIPVKDVEREVNLSLDKILANKDNKIVMKEGVNEGLKDKLDDYKNKTEFTYNDLDDILKLLIDKEIDNKDYYNNINIITDEDSSSGIPMTERVYDYIIDISPEFDSDFIDDKIILKSNYDDIEKYFLEMINKALNEEFYEYEKGEY